MRTWKIMIRPDKDAVLCRYFEENTTAAKCMYNAANFYIRNTMTGIRKSPEERTSHETEVLHYVFTGIQKANAHSYEVYCKKQEGYKKTGGMAGAVAMSKLKYKVVPYPTRDEWFLSYTVLDAIFKYTDHPTYRRMNSQVNQNAIKKTVKSWKSYFQLQKDYAIHPEKYKARPRIPGYIKQPAMTAAYTNQTAKFIRKDGHVYLRFVNHKPPVLIGKESLYSGMTYVKTEVKPQYGGYSILLTFKEDIVLPEVPKSPKRILGIDVGVDNFCAVANNFGDAPFLIKGGAVKSMNQNFNEGECFKIIEYGHDIYHLSPTNPNAPYDIIVRRNSWPDFLYASVHKKIAYEGYISVFRDTLAKILLLDLQGIFHLISDVMEKMQENIV